MVYEFLLNIVNLDEFLLNTHIRVCTQNVNIYSTRFEYFLRIPTRYKSKYHLYY
jgi:hypothetical protein